MENKSYPIILQRLLNDKRNIEASRIAWNDVSIAVQWPDENSKMTMPYLYMIKGEERFPLDLSCESIFAHDWFIIEEDEIIGTAIEDIMEGALAHFDINTGKLSNAKHKFFMENPSIEEITEEEFLRTADAATLLEYLDLKGPTVFGKIK